MNSRGFMVIQPKPKQYPKVLISYEKIDIYSNNQLDAIQQADLRVNIPNSGVVYEKPMYGCILYRVKYIGIIPEKNNKETIASGLVAIPLSGMINMPMVSYQHGTVFGKTEVPSYPKNSFETRLVLAQFAGFGYIVTGPDYYGRGDSDEKDSYLVLDSQRTSSLYMYYAALEMLEKEGYFITNVFLTGWSQGGIISMALLELMEYNNISVKAVGTAACQNDGFCLINQIINFQRKEEASWVWVCAVFTAFSFEEYYTQPGLAWGFINPDYYDVCYRVYNGLPFDPEKLPSSMTQVLRPEYFDTRFLKESQFGQLLLKLNTYRWIVKTPVHMHYGLIDESANPDLMRLAEYYQLSIGNTKIKSISEGADANHRITFARAIPKWRAWFDSL